MTDEAVKALLAEGLSLREIVRRTGRSYGYVHKQAVLMGRKMTRSHANKKDHPWVLSQVGRKKPPPDTEPLP